MVAARPLHGHRMVAIRPRVWELRRTTRRGRGFGVSGGVLDVGGFRVGPGS